MSSVGSKGVIIQDTLGGDSATVTDGRLDVNALIGATVTVALDSDSDSVECIQDTADDLNVTVGNAQANAVYTRITDGSGPVVNVTPNGELEVHIESVDSSAIFITKSYPGDSNSAINTSVTVGTDGTTEICDEGLTRVSYTIVNDSDEVIYLSIEDTPAVMNSGIRLNPNGGSFSDVFATDKVFGICASGSKNVTVCQQFI